MARQLFVQFTRESFVYGLTATAAKLVGFILVPIYVRALTVSDFGILYLVTTGTTIVSSVLILGMDSSIALTFYKTDDPSERRTIASTFLIFEIAFSLAACSLLLLAAQPIAAFIFSDASLTPYVQLGVATVPFAIYITMFLDISRLVRAPIRYMVISLGNLLLTLTLIIVAIIVLKMGVAGVLAGTLVGSIIFALVGFNITRSQYGPLFSWAVLRRMLLLGLPLVPASLSLWVVNSSNLWFVLHLTSSTEQVAILTFAIRLAAPVVLVVTAFQVAWVPFSLSIARHDFAERVYSRTLLYFLAVTFAVLLPLTLWAGPIIEIFFRATYLPAVQLIALTGMATIAAGAYQVVATGLNIAGRTLHFGWTAMVAAVVSIALNLLLIPLFGLVGAAFAGVAANVVPVVLLYVVAQRINRLPYDLPRAAALSTVASVLLFVGTVFYISDGLLDFLMRLVLLAIFGATLMVLGVVRVRDLREARSVLLRRIGRGAGA